MTPCIPPTPSRFLPTFFLHSSPGSFKKIKQNYGTQSVPPWMWVQPTMAASLKTTDSFSQQMSPLFIPSQFVARTQEAPFSPFMLECFLA